MWTAARQCGKYIEKWARIGRVPKPANGVSPPRQGWRNHGNLDMHTYISRCICVHTRTLERLKTLFSPHGQAQSIEVCFDRTKLTLPSFPAPPTSKAAAAAVPVIWMEGRRRSWGLNVTECHPSRGASSSPVESAASGSSFTPHLLPQGGGEREGFAGRAGGGGVDRNQYKTGLHVLSLSLSLASPILPHLLWPSRSYTPIYSLPSSYLPHLCSPRG